VAGRKRLQTSSDVRRLLACLINEVQNGTTDIGVAKGIAYISSVLLKSIQTDALEQRLETLERELGIKHGNRT
jgi:hypothetical protein